jgi:hypothetical protein
MKRKKTNYDLYIEEKLKGHPILRFRVWWAELKLRLLKPKKEKVKW